MLLSTQAGSGLTPVGGIIVWPKDSDPSTSSNIWLECNGQTFDTSRFPKLYKVLGSNRVPNYQGMFLRGAGSQTFSQVNGKYVNFDISEMIYTNGSKTPTTHTSGAVGEIQGDGARRIITDLDSRVLQFYATPDGDKNDITLPYNSSDRGYWKMVRNSDGALRAWGHLISTVGDDIYGNKESPIRIKFSFNPKHYRYKLNYSVSSDEDGNQVIDNISLDEYTTQAEGDEVVDANIFATDIASDNASCWPMAGEFRPANIAVKYYIRAK